MPLNHTKKELKTVLENISDGVLFIDNKGAIRLYNKALSDMLSIKEDFRGVEIFSLPMENPIRQGIFRADKGFAGPYCWERNECPSDINCRGKNSQCCRCWVFSECGSSSLRKNKSCIDCSQYKSVKPFLEKPKELEIGEKTISVLSSFIEIYDKNEIWEVLVFKDVTSEKLDAAMKLAGATAHELRQPLQIIMSCISLIGDNFSFNQELNENFNTMKENCLRMNSIIDKINTLARYKTKHYIMNERILDIEGSSGSTKKTNDARD